MDFEKFIIITLFDTMAIIMAIIIDNAMSPLPDAIQFLIQLLLLFFVIENFSKYIKSVLRVYRHRFGQNISDSDIDMIATDSYILTFFVSGGLKQCIMRLYNIPYILTYKKYK
jgi:hypothetical protein